MRVGRPAEHPGNHSSMLEYLMPRTIAFAAALLLASLQPVSAINENAGTTGFNSLKIGVGARPAALGGAFAAVAGDLESTHWNPAGLLGLPGRAATISMTQYVVDTQAGFLSVAFPREKRVWGFSLNYFSAGEMRRTDEEGADLGTFSAADLAAYATVAQRAWSDRITLGLNLKAVYSSIGDYSSDAYMVDIGVLAPTPISGMTMGASLSNLGAVRSGYSGDSKDSLPVNIRLGVSHRPAHTPLPMIVLADLNVPNDNDPYLAVGVEFRVGRGLYLRPGYSTRQVGSEGNEPLGPTGGAGFLVQGYRLDYAYSSLPELGEVHRLALSGSF